MYDISGVPSSEIEAKIKTDYLHLVSLMVLLILYTYSIADFRASFQLNDLRAFDDPMYLHEKGRPVVAIWGASARGSTSTVPKLID
jgi:hypothetical protein